MTIKDAMKSDEVSYYDFYNFLMETNIGSWDEVNSTEIIHDYINEKMRDGYFVSHILQAMERERYVSNDWKMGLDNSLNTPEPIRSKEDLADALSLSDEELNMGFTPQTSEKCHLHYDYKEER